MKILSLAEGCPETCRIGMSGADALRARLSERWAILFSHPEDFAQEELEMDRWISVLSRSFVAQGVIPMALAGVGRDPEQSWLGRLVALSRESADVLTLDPSPRGAPADLAAAALLTLIARSGPRFAMIIDSSLRCRRTLGYRLPTELPSPLDLIGWAVALRKRDEAECGPRATPEPWLPALPGRARSARYALAQAGRR